MDYGIHWFRRDLRVAGNRALMQNWKKNQGRVVGFFCFDKNFLSRPDFSVNRFQFFIDTLCELKKELRLIGSDLLVWDEPPHLAFPRLLKQIEAESSTHPNLISWNRDYEPFARERDQKLSDYFAEVQISTLTRRDHLVIEPQELSKPDGGGYQVYSPFARKWLELVQTEKIQPRILQQSSALAYLEKLEKETQDSLFSMTWTQILPQSSDDHLDRYQSENLEKVTVPIPKAGSLAALKQLKSFSEKLEKYGDLRDFPALENTSGFSPFLKNGSLTTAMIIRYFQLQPYVKKESGKDVFFSELIWREFYYHILYRHPLVEKQSFLAKYQDIRWDDNIEFFQKWKDGMTGFPIVDAGMRQLKTTGLMHNRVRMIVASFLTKDLLVNWQWGEKYFMEQLLDGDLAPNNGGWQWAASTGCDPQPYFRIFNPWRQGEKFDKEGAYIKKYLPELSDLPAKELHSPILGHASYPEPMVDHSVQRKKALLLYKQ